MSQMAAAEASKQAQSAPVSAKGVLQRKCDKCRKKKPLMQRAAAGPSPETVPPIVNEVLRSPGQPLDPVTRAFMEPRFGHDFTRVPVQSVNLQASTPNLRIGPANDSYEQEANMRADRIMRATYDGVSNDMKSVAKFNFNHVRLHTDPQAAESAQALNALAYTSGKDIVLGAGLYDPATIAGRRLLAHELTHVAQQEGVYHASDTPLIQFQLFSGCTPGITGVAMTQDKLDNFLLGSRMAAEFILIFAESAVRNINNGTGSAREIAAFANHFGNPTTAQRNTILNRFGTISRRLSSNSLFICNTSRSAYCARGWCAYSPCPQASSLTHICPPFFNSGSCGEPELTMIHESAHAAGACNDIYPGSGYPPANAHNNAPSYEEFVKDIF